MDRVKTYFIRPWNSAAMLSDATIPRFVWEHLLRVYCTLCYASVFALFGAFGHLFFDIGGRITAVGFVGSLWWMSRIKPWKEFRRVIFFMAAALFWGATIGPLINFIIEMDQRDVIKIIMGGIVFFSCHLGAAIHSLNRDSIYQTGEFSSPILITAWMVISETHDGLLTHAIFLLVLPFPWYLVVFLLEFIRNRLPMWFKVPFHLLWISFLCYCFKFPFLDLMYVYLIVLWLLAHMKMHSQEAVFLAAHHTQESFYVGTTITFFTDLPAHTVSLFTHNVGIMIGKIKHILQLLHLR